MVWYSHLSQNFPQFIVFHIVKGFGIVNKAEIDVFLELSCFFNDAADVGNLISGSSAFSKTSLNIWKFTVHILLKNFEHFLLKKPSYGPAIPLLGIYPEETKVEEDMCIPLFSAALFTIARTWKQPRCPSTDEWIKKSWFTCTMEYYSAIKSNAFESVLMRWMNLEPIIQSEVSQKEKDKYHILTMAPHSSTLAWKVPWTEEPGRLQSMGLLRVGHD